MQKIQALIPPDRVEAMREALVAACFSRFDLAPLESEGPQRPGVELTVMVDDADVERALGTILRVSAPSAGGEGVFLLSAERRPAGKTTPTSRPAPLSTAPVPRTWSWRPGSR